MLSSCSIKIEFFGKSANSKKKHASRSRKKIDKERAIKFFGKTNGNYWENRYLSDFKFSINVTDTNILASGNKIKINNKPYLDECKNQAGCQSEADIVIKGHGIKLVSVPIEKLNNWNDDNFDHALESFMNSCNAFARYEKQGIQIKAAGIVFGSTRDWLKVCNLALFYIQNKDSKRFFEDNFIPFAVYNGSSDTGKFTGYYELSVDGSRTKTDKYKYAIHTKPEECKGEKKCYTREELHKGKSKGTELFWVDDFIDLWRLQMQGSGIVDFEDGSYARVAYGGGNGHKAKNFLDYFKKHDVLPPDVNTPTEIYAWMRKNPDEGIKAMNYNPAYLFFNPMNEVNKSAIGAQVVNLTPSRSIAVDRYYVPFGMPMWIETKVAVKDDQGWIKMNRLVVAQDTGSAIKGTIRADVFFGHGWKARYLSETMRFDGKYYFMIPKNVLKNIDK